MRPIALTDPQLRIVTEAARPLPYEKRAAFLERVAAQLGSLGYRRVADRDVESAVRAALHGLLHAPAA
jgi:hypothetical protein